MKDYLAECSHGVMLIPEANCLECDMSWHRDQHNAALKAVKRHAEKMRGIKEKQSSVPPVATGSGA